MRTLILVLATATFLRAGTGHVVGLPMFFEQHTGQAVSNALYVGRNSEGAVLVKSRDVVFLGSQGAVAMRFPGSGRYPRLEASEKTAITSRYFIKRGVHTTALEAPQYRSVRYRNLYAGISLVLRGNPTELEYDFVIAPHANPKEIRLAFDGIERMELTASGDLILYTPAGRLWHRRPIAFQEISGERKSVDVVYRLVGKRQVAFVVSGYDDSIPLVIDPTVAWTSASVQGTINDLAIDSANNVYLAGFTPSGRGVCATTRLFGTNGMVPCNDAFVMKLDPTGTQILYNTILGGLSEDEAASIAVDSVGNAYVLGTTYSADFPVSSGAAQKQYAGPTPNGNGMTPISVGGDLFVVKLDAGGKLLYSTFLGSTDDESAGRIRVDAGGNAYVSGGTRSSRFPTSPGAYISSLQFGGGVVAKINSTGTQVLWSTYVRSGLNSAVIELDRAGSALYAAVGPEVIKLNSDGAFAGAFDVANETESAGGLALDSQGNLWVVGTSRFGVAFIAKAKPGGSALTFQTRFGGGAGGALAVAVDGMDRAFAAGQETGVPITSDALLPTPPAAPGFLMTLNADGTVAYASYALASIRALALGSPAQVYTTDGRSVTRTDFNAPPVPFIGYLVNAASFGGNGHSAPGEIVSIFGSALGPQGGMDLQLDSDGRVATSLAGTQVLFNGIRAPLLYVSDRQINTVVPFGVPVGKTALVEVEAGGKKSAALAVEIEPVAPEIFTVAGTSTAQAAALNQDGVPNSTDHPALQGSIISLFATGVGDVAPPLADGQLGPTPPSALTAPVQVLFGGVPGG